MFPCVMTSSTNLRTMVALSCAICFSPLIVKEDYSHALFAPNAGRVFFVSSLRVMAVVSICMAGARTKSFAFCCQRALVWIAGKTLDIFDEPNGCIYLLD